jgi:AcrR family transcriptional regulator
MNVKIDTIVQTVNADYLHSMKSRNAAASQAKTTRPAQCLKRVPILDAAAEVFCREGFSGASIDEIAEEACVSRQTIYNHYREKETLFVAVVADVTARANTALFAALAAFPDKPENLRDDLIAFAVDLNRNCLYNQDGKFLRKLVQSEGPRYPHLFEAWREHGPCKIGMALGAIFARLHHQGLLHISDCDLAARQFTALINADLQMTTLFGETPTEEELQGAAEQAVDMFLRGYGARAEAVPKPNTYTAP